MPLVISLPLASYSSFKPSPAISVALAVSAAISALSDTMPCDALAPPSWNGSVGEPLTQPLGAV